MKKIYMIIVSVVVIIIGAFFALGYLSSYIGWYGYKKWEHRVATTSVKESKARGVFIKLLKFEIDSFSGQVEDFQPYIEKGFRYGRHSSEETVPLTGSNYPYQLSFKYYNTPEMGLLIREADLKKFDSSNLFRGYLKTPDLPDTITYDIVVENIKSGTIKIYQ